jgi:uncharacterized damage-inducible protein DinB
MERVHILYPQPMKGGAVCSGLLLRSPAQWCRVSPMNAPCSRPGLDFHRQTLLMKCTGLRAEQLKRRSAPPSTLTLHGLVRHMAEVERDWFRICFAGQNLRYLYSTEAWPTADFDDLEAADPATDFATFAAEVRLARAVTVGRSLDDTFVHPQRGVAINLRWGYVHMIEEYARHNGHADLLRERIDTGSPERSGVEGEHRAGRRGRHGGTPPTVVMGKMAFIFPLHIAFESVPSKPPQ